MSMNSVALALQDLPRLPPMPGLKVVIIASNDQLDEAQYYGDALRSKNIQVWSIADAFAGQVLDLVVRKKLRDAHFIVVLVDSESLCKSGSHNKHLKWAFELQDEMPERAIKVIPALLEYVDPNDLPDHLSGLWRANFYESGGGGPLLAAFATEWERRRQAEDL